MQKSNLRQHMKAVHFEQKSFPCSIPGCGMSFTFKHVRDNHEKSGYHLYVQVSSFFAEALSICKKVKKLVTSFWCLCDVLWFRVILLRLMSSFDLGQGVDGKGCAQL